MTGGQSAGLKTPPEHGAPTVGQSKPGKKKASPIAHGLRHRSEASSLLKMILQKSVRRTVVAPSDTWRKKGKLENGFQSGTEKVHTVRMKGVWRFS